MANKYRFDFGCDGWKDCVLASDYEALAAELALEKQLRADVTVNNITFIKQIRRLQASEEEQQTRAKALEADRDQISLTLDVAKADRDKWFNRARDLEKALRQWETNCTGKHGSQMPCCVPLTLSAAVGTCCEKCGKLFEGPGTHGLCSLCWASTAETRAQQCEWTLSDGQYISTCDPNKFINMSPAGMTYCPYCSRSMITSDRGVK